MASRRQRHILLRIAFLTLTIVGTSAHAQGIPIVTGEQWMASSDDMKKAYLVGIANLLEIETAYAGSSASAGDQDLAPRFAKGMQGQTLDGVRQELDSWYSAHPTMIQHPVIETLWFQIARPGLNKQP